MIGVSNATYSKHHFKDLDESKFYIDSDMHFEWKEYQTETFNEILKGDESIISKWNKKYDMFMLIF
ncbi:hypothetical protein BpHYR1_000388 [Brachionus plicatilis]|uniref:Uncharacterized protein n=1 Tax=Brachionus plicatilis TaxID=10195 RepID=A0A3M7Q4V6_BRAPC|nr:hypothetical protein BpHYR1_000388 [Brachionus plicatilis]